MMVVIETQLDLLVNEKPEIDGKSYNFGNETIFAAMHPQSVANERDFASIEARRNGLILELLQNSFIHCISIDRKPN